MVVCTKCFRQTDDYCNICIDCRVTSDVEIIQGENMVW